MIENVPKFDEQNIPVLNKQLKKLWDEKPTIRFYEGTPTAADVNIRELLFTDAGRIYWKQADGTLKYLAGT